MQNIDTSTSYYSPIGSAQVYERHLESPGRHLESAGRHLESTGQHLESPGRHLESTGQHVNYQGRHLESPGRHLETPPPGYQEMNNRGDFSSLSQKGTQ